MSDLPAITYLKAITAFKRAGFREKEGREGRNPVILVKPGHRFHLSFHVHRKDVPRGLLRRLIRDAGLTEEQFIELL